LIQNKQIASYSLVTK